MTGGADADAIRIDPAGGGPADFCAVVLHGLGADGSDLAPLAKQLPALARFRTVLPNAPHRPITVNGGMTMRAWYDIAGIDLEQRQDAEGIAESAEAIRRIIAAEVQAGVAPGRIFLAGFSQGGAMSLHVGLRQPEPLAGIASLSGYLPLADTLESEISPAAGDVPVFMAHGSRDPIVPVTAAHASRDALAAAGVEVEYREYPIDHGISMEEAEALNGWLNRARAKAEER